MDMVNLNVLYIYFISFLFYLTESKCIDKRCESKQNQYKQCNIGKRPDNSYIISMDIKQDYSIGHCQYSVTYGYNTTKIWVDKGCRAKFVVCFSVGQTPVVRTTTTTEENRDTTQPSKISSTKTVTSEVTTPLQNSSTSQINKNKSSSAGIIGGVVAGVVIVTILVVVIIVIRRRYPNLIFKCLNEQMKTSTDHLGNQNVALPIESTTSKDTGYSSLQSQRDNHYYKGFNTTEDPAKEVYGPPTYLALYDSFDLNQSSRDSTTDGQLAIDNAEYEDIEQKKKSLRDKRATEQEQIQYDYAEFSENPAQSEQDSYYTNEKYVILDPKETGFDRHSRGNQDCETYELAKPISENSDDDKYTEGNSQYMPSNENCYDHAHDNRHVSDPNNITYSHSVDTVYDSVYEERNTADTYVNYTNS